MNPRILYFLPLVMAVLGMSFAVASDSDAAILARIMRDWQARRTAMARVRYDIRGTRMIPKGTYTEEVRVMFGKVDGEVPPEDEIVKTSIDMLFDFQNFRHRIEERLPPLPGFHDDINLPKAHSVRFYDGKIHEYWYPKMGPTRPELKRLSSDGGLPEPRWLPILFGHGFADTRDPFSHMPKTARLDPSLFTIQAKTTLNGRPIVVLRFSEPDPRSRTWLDWWVDLTRQSAVTRFTVYHETSKLRDYRIEYTKGERGWFPKSWRFSSHYGTVADVDAVFEYTVRKMLVDPPVKDSMFRKKMTPGMAVRDGTIGRTYVVAEDGTPGRDFAPVRRSRVVAKLRKDVRSRGRWRWLTLVLGGIAIAGSSAIYYWIRKK